MEPKNRALLFTRIWYESTVSVFLERFLLSVCATVFVGVVILNVMKIDGHYRFAIGLMVVGAAYFIGHLVDLNKKPTTPGAAPASTLPRLEQPTFHESLDHVNVEIGKGGFLQTIPLSEIPGRLTSIEGIGLGTVSIENGLVSINTEILDASGAMVIKIERNEFSVKPHNWDKNSTQNALEIVDENRQPRFQLIRTSPATIQIFGMFYGPGGSVLVADQTGFRSGDSINTPPVNRTPFKLKPIFRYPSWKFPGKYAEGSN